MKRSQHRPDSWKTWAAVVVPALCVSIALAVNARREITALESDASVAIFMSLGYLRGEFSPVYPPGLSFFISAMRSLGLPLRIANVLLTFFASAAVCYLMIAPSHDRRIRIVLAALFGLFFGLVPTIVYEGDITGNVFFSGLCNLALLASVALATKTRSLKIHAAIIAIAGLAAVSRPDPQIMKATLLLWPFLAAIFPTRRMPYFVNAALACMIALVAMTAGQAAVTRFNLKTYGVDRVANYLDSRYSDLFATIAALPSPEPTDRYFLADKPRRELAYTLSPTLNAYRNAIENDTGVGAIGFDAGQQFFGRRDIANAFYYWHLDNVLRQQNLSLADYLAVLGKSAEEIQTNAAQKRIPLERLYFGVLTPAFALWMPHIPEGLAKAYAYSFAERKEAVRYGETSPALAEAYNKAALRRSALLADGEGHYPQPPFAGFFSGLHLVLFYGFLPVVIALLIVIGRAREDVSRASLFVLLLLSCAAFRVFYYGLLDASFYRATINYLNPNFILVYFIYLCAILILIEQGVSARGRWTAAKVQDASERAERRRSANET